MPQDPELRAVAAVMRTLEPLSKDSQRRVMSYVSERLRADVRFDTSELMAAMACAMKAIAEAASELDISGPQLMAVVLEMYNQAKESNANNEEPAPNEVQPPGGSELQSPTTPTI